MSVSFEEANYFVLESSPSSFDVCIVISGIIERNVEVTVTAVELTAQSEHDNSLLTSSRLLNCIFVVQQP